MCSVSRTVNLEMTSNSAALEFSSSKMAYTNNQHLKSS